MACRALTILGEKFMRPTLVLGSPNQRFSFLAFRLPPSHPHSLAAGTPPQRTTLGHTMSPVTTRTSPSRHHAAAPTRNWNQKARVSLCTARACTASGRRSSSAGARGGYTTTPRRCRWTMVSAGGRALSECVPFHAPTTSFLSLSFRLITCPTLSRLRD